MTQPNAEPHLSELDRALNSELAKDLPNAKLRHDPHTLGARGQAATRPPVVPVAGVGVGEWGPSSPPPTMTAQLDCIHTDAQRLIDTLQDMQKALAVIRGKLG